MRHLLNYCHKGADLACLDSFYLLQETYIENPGKIPYIWRGNFYLTPGEGHSGGCLTLMSSHLSVVCSREIEKRAHVLACQRKGGNSISYIVVNVYAPNPNSREKIEFFEKLFELIHELEVLYDCSNIIVGGDFNLTFKNSEAKNRNRSAQEKRVASYVRDAAAEVGLIDIWGKTANFTWRRPNTECFSCLDHVLFNEEILELTMVKTNWSMSYSDHAAVEITFALKDAEKIERTRIPRLDPSLIKTPENKADYENRFNEIWRHVCGTWDPHSKLEYAKMCIRTVGEQMQAERKRRELSEEEELNDELNMAINSLERGGKNPRSTAALIGYVEELRQKKATLVERKGERLAEKLGSKWYNEGEKSTRYFLRLLNRRSPDKFGELVNSRGETIKRAVDIEAEIVNYYKNLYENYDKAHLIDDADENAFFANITPISGQSANDVTREITLEDLTKTLHTCRDSAPGPDGIPYSYLGALWNTLGPLICEAWNHSVRTGKLCPSHKTSFLRLIPKADKDSKKLTNWRPITLSNCDHKLVTKTYSIRMADKVSASIGARQTAYLKGRLINDNIRAIMLSIHLANVDDETIDGLLVSLDAKKAFDSVEHSYIEKCLTRFGLRDFVPIFKILYSELRSDILVNGKVVNGYSIKRGVKQGDALSCILFIMCMEPLIANIENNVDIAPLHSARLRSNLPKAYTYADDLNCTIKNSRAGLQAVFDEYTKLTKIAGLELNADKTEVMRFANVLKGSRFNPEPLEIRYMNKRYLIQTSEETKINGIFFQQNEERMKTGNVRRILEKMENQLGKWSRRSLSVLGKILIVKTFGISQAIFLMQSITLDKVHFKMLNELLYKFIWNRHFRAPKAPERVKREIINLPIKLGGFGMLNIEELDNGLKLRSLGRLLTTDHPLLKLLKNKLDLSDFFFPTFDGSLDSYVARGVELLRLDRQKLWLDENAKQSVGFVSALRAAKLVNLVKPQYRNNLRLFLLNRAGKRKVEDLSAAEFESIANLLLNGDVVEAARRVVPIRAPPFNVSMESHYYHRRRWVELGKLSSKEIRESRVEQVPLSIFKCGLIMTPSESLGWLKAVNGLNSTAHKNAILRFAHGDVYSKERLFRFGLSDTPQCEHCQDIETVNHRIYECNYAKNLWQEVGVLTGTNSLAIEMIVGAYADCSKAMLTIHAELILRLIRSPNLTQINAATFVRTLIKTLSKREQEIKVKRELDHLLNG